MNVSTEVSTSAVSRPTEQAKLPEFRPVSVMHLTAAKEVEAESCACCWYNSSTPGCS
ncbi:hypothetical protein P2318_10645 [Myxococcaceae bacterium GXIMD 01537]